MSCCLETSFDTKASFFSTLCFVYIQCIRFQVLLWLRIALRLSSSEHVRLPKWSVCPAARVLIPESDVLSSTCAAFAATNLLCWFMLTLPERRSIRHWAVGVGEGLCRSSVSCLQKMQPSPTVPFVPWKLQRERAPLWILFTGEHPNLIVPQSL